MSKRGGTGGHHLDGAARQTHGDGPLAVLACKPRTFSTLVSAIPAGKDSSSPTCPFLTYISVVQAAASPFVGVGDAEGDQEAHHDDQSEQAQLVEADGPRT